MPPKTDIDSFIAACFRALKERPQIDWSRVAEETGMSVGGAQNKFRDWARRFQQEHDDSEVSSAQVTSTVEKPTGKRRVTHDSRSDSDDDGNAVGKIIKVPKKMRGKKSKKNVAAKNSSESGSITRATISDVTADAEHKVEIISGHTVSSRVAHYKADSTSSYQDGAVDTSKPARLNRTEEEEEDDGEIEV